MRNKNFFSLITLILLASGFLFTGCERGAESCFSVSNIKDTTGQLIQFTNCSNHADRYSWDFGDGTTSTEFSPSHAYTSPGSYKVQLIAYRGKDKNKNVTWKGITVYRSLFTFYTSYSLNYPINVTIGSVTHIISNYQPMMVCYSYDTTGNANFFLSPGTYSYTAAEQPPGTMTWFGTIQNGCFDFAGVAIY